MADVSPPLSPRHSQNQPWCTAPTALYRVLRTNKAASPMQRAGRVDERAEHLSGPGCTPRRIAQTWEPQRPREVRAATAQYIGTWADARSRLCAARQSGMRTDPVPAHRAAHTRETDRFEPVLPARGSPGCSMEAVPIGDAPMPDLQMTHTQIVSYKRTSRPHGLRSDGWCGRSQLVVLVMRVFNAHLG